MSVRGDVVETRPIAGTRPRFARRRRRGAHPRADRPSQGTRRARDADRPGAQRPRPRVRAGQRRGRRAHGGRKLRACAPHRLQRARPAARGRDARARSSARCFPAARSPVARRCAACRSSPSSKAGRGAYTGAIGYLNRDGDLDLNILIRSAGSSDGDALRFRAGAGIVVDSDPQRELEETRAKARGLLRALGVGGMTRASSSAVDRRGDSGGRPRPALWRWPVRDAARARRRVRGGTRTGRVCAWRRSACACPLPDAGQVAAASGGIVRRWRRPCSNWWSRAAAAGAAMRRRMSRSRRGWCPGITADARAGQGLPCAGADAAGDPAGAGRNQAPQSARAGAGAGRMGRRRIDATKACCCSIDGASSAPLPPTYSCCRDGAGGRRGSIVAASPVSAAAGCCIC